MLILFDHGTPRSIARWLQGHVVVEAIARGWDKLSNGALLKVAEEAGFDLLLSTDRTFGINNTVRPCIATFDRVIATVNSATPGSCAEVDIPYE